MNVVLPKLGMGIEEATISKWLKKVGERVAEGESIAEVETAKATQPIEALGSGVLVKIVSAEGETVPVNSVIAVIE